MSDAVKIDKGIPVPGAGRNGSLTTAAYEMDIGDSFFIPPGKYKSGTLAGHMNRMASPKRFLQRKEGNGSRIWRIA